VLSTIDITLDAESDVGFTYAALRALFSIRDAREIQLLTAHRAA